MLIVALPALRVVAADVYAPLLSTTDPVGVGTPPVTFTVTLSADAVERLCAPGVTVTVGVITPLTVTLAVPEALLYFDELAESGV
jgi:hypothetical protein